jgi:hypothetical protein
MATATKQSRANRQVPRRASSRSAHFLALRTTAATIAGRSSPATARASRTPGHTQHLTTRRTPHASVPAQSFSSEAVTQ